MSARFHRPYPPDWCDDDTMAYLLDMSVSAFRSYVNSGLLPEGKKIGGIRRWNRQTVLARLAEPDGARNDDAIEDPIMRAARGEKAEHRRGTA